jgi:hypothetical protein
MHRVHAAASRFTRLAATPAACLLALALGALPAPGQAELVGDPSESGEESPGLLRSLLAGILGTDTETIDHYEDRLDTELDARGYGDEGSGWLDAILERLMGADEAELGAYADQVDSAMGGRLGQELDDRGYGEEARSLWQRARDWMLGADDGY